VSRATLASLTAPDAFQWLAGIEDTFVTAPSPRTGRSLDEYALTGHYAHVEADRGLFASLGLRSVRYGIPWHRIQPRPDAWDFGWTDRALERLLSLGIRPVVDLVHYGLPPWIEGAWLDPSLPARMADYAGRVAERYRGRIHAYTPLNEPRVTAWYCGRLGWWPPALRGTRGYLRVMLGVCRSIAATGRRLLEVDPEIVLVHVDATDLYESDDPSLAAQAALRQQLVFLPLDLVTGRVDARHPLRDWLSRHGAADAEIDAFATDPVGIDVLGINLYPLFSLKRLVRTRSGVRIRMPYAPASIVGRLARMYWTRYRRPLLIAETASEGPVARRAAWLDASVAAVAAARARGVPLVGYTWWPLFALVTWGYREGRLAPDAYLRQMGLWDLRPGEAGLERVPTPLVDRYRALVAGGASAVGTLAPPEAAEPPET
jgi:beta-glucosidase/6-phospho-beta-glucosidase/beta-galactosidase